MSRDQCERARECEVERAVDPVDLALVELGEEQVVEGTRRLEVGAEGLLHHHPRPTRGMVQAGGSKCLDGRCEGPRRDGEIEDPIAG